MNRHPYPEDMRFLLPLLTAVLVSTSATAREPTTKALAAQFEAIVFGPENRDKRDQKRIHRWDGRIHYMFSLQGGEDERVRPFVLNMMAAVVDATEMEAVREDDPDVANFFIWIAPRDRFTEIPEMQQPEGPDCGHISSLGTGPGSFSRVFLAAAVDSDAFTTCLPGEAAKALGLSHDGCEYRPSAFCSRDRSTDITLADHVLLRTLYDPRLKPGMTKEQAMPIAREIIRELWGE